MERINVYSDDEIISRVVAADGVEALEESLRPYGHIFAVSDARVSSRCPAMARIDEILARCGAEQLLLEVSEETKTIDTVLEICSWLQKKRADRDALVLGIGGGITTDMAGFAASIYKRGVRFAYIPTTLLAQVDASIGGKTGVNFERYKNILGVIRQPEFTYLCPQVLESLPRRDFLSGAAEMIKTFIIDDGGNYAGAVSLLERMSAADGDRAWPEIVNEHMPELLPLITAAARVKAGVVSRDQFESGERRKLNLGHTFAHAIETLARRENMDMAHGEAVAIGLLFAARLADRVYGTSSASVVEEDLRRCSLVPDSPFTIKAMAEVMGNDKKAEGGRIHFVLPRAVGDVVIEDLTVEDVVEFLK